MMKRNVWLMVGILTSGLLVSCGTVGATVFTDDFNRADGSLGSNWTTMFDGGDPANNKLVIKDNVVTGENNGALVLYTATGAVLDKPFTASIQVKAHTSDPWEALLFHATDLSSSYCAVAITPGVTDIFLWVTGGTKGEWTDYTSGGTFAADTWYTITVSSSMLGQYHVNVTDGTHTWSGNTTITGITGAYAGVWNYGGGGGGTQGFADNFNLNVVPEPLTMGFLLLGGLLFRRRIA